MVVPLELVVVVAMGAELSELGLKGAVTGRGFYILDVLLCVGYRNKVIT